MENRDLADLHAASERMIQCLEYALETDQADYWQLVDFWAGCALSSGRRLPGAGMDAP